MKKLLARIKQWNNSNAGLTLVEIIVTMLILVIIALPILGGFITAARANAMAKDLAYARDAAENVVEVANSAGVSAEIFNAVGWGCTPTPTPSITLAPGVTVTPIPVEEYVVTGIRSGTGTYTAKVICNRTTYQDANTYDLPDMAALDSEKTVVIFPESNFYTFDDEGNLDVTDSATLHRFDTTAIRDIYQDYHDGIADIYNNVVYAGYMEEVRRIEGLNEEIVLQPSPSPTLAPPVMPDYPTIIRKENDALPSGEEPIKLFIHRNIGVKVVYNPSSEPEDEDGVQATVSTEYSYQMKDNILGMGTLKEMVSASFEQYWTTEDLNMNGVPDNEDFSYIDFSATGELQTAITALANKLQEAKNYTVAAETTVDTLENIYLVTYPFNASTRKISDYNTLVLSAEVGAGVDFNYADDKEVSAFLVIQEDAEYSPSDTDSFRVSAGNMTALNLFVPCSQMDMLSSEYSISDDNKTLYNNRDNSEGNVLLDVTVKIYNEGDVGPGKELTQVKTTISSKK